MDTHDYNKQPIVITITVPEKEFLIIKEVLGNEKN